MMDVIGADKEEPSTADAESTSASGVPAARAPDVADAQHDDAVEELRTLSLLHATRGRAAEERAIVHELTQGHEAASEVRQEEASFSAFV
jgi:hypothetical protein